MADQGNDVLTDLDGAPGAGAGAGDDTQPVAGFAAQYIKDLSVENPNSPRSMQLREQPKLDVQVNIAAEGAGEGMHEVALKIVATATGSEGTLYIVDLTYCGLIGMRNLGEDQQHMFLYSEAPRILFPFARQIVANAVQDAGFPPLMLDPLDFQGMYMQQLAQRRAEHGEDYVPPVTGNVTGNA